MATKRYSPATPGLRFLITPSFEELTTDKPERKLTSPIKRTGGRNNLVPGCGQSAGRRCADTATGTGHQRQGGRVHQIRPMLGENPRLPTPLPRSTETSPIPRFRSGATMGHQAAEG